MTLIPNANARAQASNHEPIKAFVNGSEVTSFIALTDDNKAARLKRNLHSTFSSNGVLAYETHVNHTVSELVTHLRAAGPTTDLTKWTAWFAFDTMARIAFSEDQGFMSHQEDIGGAIDAGRKRFAHWAFYWAIPWLDAILYKNWFARRSRRPPSGITRLAIRAIESRKAKGGIGTHHDLLDLYMKSSETDPELFTPPTIIGLAITTIQAGSETTAYTIAICLHFLLENPRVLAKLRAELESVTATTASGWAVPSMSVLRSLPYLEACIKESNRLRPTISIMAERVVPAGGATIGGVHIPGGTIVASNTGGIYTDPSTWGADVDVYRPERWLEENQEQRIKMNRANLLFSAGKRMCLGANVSWLEMRKVIPALTMNFEVCFNPHY
jgi:cytochrome P450